MQHKKVKQQIAFYVCIQQKIPELIPLLFGSGSKKFHEHLTRGRYLLKCKREEISDNVFALGVMSPANLSRALMSLIENRLGSISKAFMFQRIQGKRDIMHTTSYLNVSRRNSWTVFVDNVGFLEIKFYVKLFVQCPNVLFCTNARICKSPHYGISDCCLRQMLSCHLTNSLIVKWGIFL